MARMTTTPTAGGKALCLALLPLVLATASSALDDPDALAEEALTANPGLEARRARIAELADLATAAGTWEDPVIGLEYSNTPVDSFSLDDHPMSGLQIRVQQTLPPWGSSRLREDVAESRAIASEYALAEAENRLRGQVSVLYWKLTLSRMLEQVTREHVARAEELLRAVRARYETGAAGQHEILRLEVLRDRLSDDLGDFAREDRELGAALSRTLSRPADTPFDTPKELGPVQVAGAPSKWLALAREQKPELRRIEESIRTEESGAELARLERLPDVTVFLGYRVRRIDTPLDDGTDQVSAGISVPIPWGSWKRSRAGLAARLQAARGGRAQLAAELDRIRAELAAIHARWTRAFEQAVVYRDHLTPNARTAVEAALADYTVGRADFAALFQAEVDLLDLERTHRAATLQTHIEQALARQTIGAPPQGDQP